MEDVSNEDEHDTQDAHEEEPCDLSEDAKADKRTRRNRVKDKETEGEAVNGVENANDDQNASELALKKEVRDGTHKN